LTKISYEYQSPLGEYGQVREGFHRLKLLHFFLKDFGDLLAPMTVLLPANASALKPDNIHDLRYAARVKGNSGFLFLNNFQDDTTMSDKNNIQVKIKTANGDMLIPESGGVNLVGGENVIFPFNFNLGGTQLNYATAQLLMKGGPTNQYFVFFTPKGIYGEFSFAPGTKIETIRGAEIDLNDRRVLVKCLEKVSEFSVIADGKKTNVLVIDKNLALKSYIVMLNGKKSLIFSDPVVLQNENSFELLSTGISDFILEVYPKVITLPKASFGKLTKIEGSPAFTSYRIGLPSVEFAVSKKDISSRKIAVALPQTIPAGVNDIYLIVNYTGDTGMGFLNGELFTDNFYNGIPWQIGIRKLISSPAKPKEMVFYFRPMQKNASYLLDLQPYPQFIPDFGKANSFLKINSISFTTQYKTNIKF
ncbi:MAG: hypothetical protein WBC06_12295, partial [Chitinophagaceae bacterium]